ncbi:uncharacterized protein TRUGW13939_11213 [Talaromyces rugulosus]|uniref:Fucose-specific lectin n=1 Tax=Talaromyces rugulosus TaxID=121627 RepID=A0A7H8RC56_TALRU|nr:uncharacterized protein TRUGW13939_11213 [Talaromyces rugulosus]QKX64040.1 hypothetical protein TRUGW13939_11213 [Talaromyces rugulosus]
MSGIAAIKTPSHDDIQVFYTTTKSNLGLDIRKAIHSNNNPTKGYIATSTDPDGNVVTSSDIAVSSYLGIQFVVGITRNPAGTTGAPSGTTLNNISILSPISQTIARVEQDNSRITSCSNGIQSSVFYLRKHPHDPEGSHLWEYDFDSGQAKHVDDLANVRKGSGLASYYTKDDRLVVYQDKKGVIREYSSKTTDILMKNNRFFYTASEKQFSVDFARGDP